MNSRNPQTSNRHYRGSLMARYVIKVERSREREGVLKQIPAGIPNLMTNEINSSSPNVSTEPITEHRLIYTVYEYQRDQTMRWMKRGRLQRVRN